MAKAPVDSDLDLTQEVVRLQNRVAELEQALAEGCQVADNYKMMEQQRRYYEFIANTSREFMTLIDRRHVYEVVNEAYCRAHGKAMHEIVGHHVAQVWGEDRYRQVIKRHLDRCFAGHEVHYQGWFDFAELGNRHFDVTYYPFVDENGTVSHAVVVSHDFTVRKEAEDQLAESERRYRLISDMVATYIYGYRLEADGSPVIEWVTDSFIRETKYTLAELIDLGGFVGITLPEDQPLVEQRVANVLAGQTVVSTFRIITKTGDVRWLQDYARPIWDEKRERVVAIYGASQDISEQKRAEVALRENQLLLKQITDLIPQAIFVYDLETHRHIYLNQYIVELLGYSLAEIEVMGDNLFATLLHPDDYARYDDFIHHLHADEDRAFNETEYRMRHRDGTWRWFSCREVIFSRGNDHRPHQTLGVIQDITQRQEIQEALQKAHQTLKFHVENSPLGVIEWDNKRRVQHWSKRAEMIFGWSAAEAVHRRWDDPTFIFGGSVAQTQRIDGLMDRQHPRRVDQYYTMTKDGSVIFCAWYESALFDDQGRLVSVLSLVEDVSAQKQAEESLQHLLELKQLITTISADFIDMTADMIDAGINHALALIGQFLAADRSYLVLLADDGYHAIVSYEWHTAEVRPWRDRCQSLPMPDFSWALATITAQNYLHISDLNELPPAAKNELTLMQSLGIRSLVGVAMVYGEKMIGFLGFNAEKMNQHWSEAVISLLELVGSVFVNALQRKQVEATLRLSDERYELAASVGKVGVWDWDLRRNEVYLSPNLKAMLGYEDQAIPNRVEAWLNLLHPDDREIAILAVEDHLRHHTPQFEVELRMIHQDGSARWLLIRGIAFQRENGIPTRILGANTDITDLKQVEEILQYRIALEELILMISTRFINLPIDHIDHEIRQTLKVITSFFNIESSYIALKAEKTDRWRIPYIWMAPGITPDELPLAEIYARVFPWGLQQIEHIGYFHVPTLAEFPPALEAERLEYERAGIQSFILVPLNRSTRLVGLIGLVSYRQENYWPIDVITILKLIGEMFVNALERKHTEAVLQDSLKEKEILLKEIHHRVKNNLQIVSSLLYLQANDVHDKQMAEMFQDSQSRIRSMALIHEKLYETNDLVRVNFVEYVESLLIHLQRSYKIDPERIAAVLDIGSISLNIDTAIPCGLIINELISNSFKHAFPSGRQGEIQLSLQQRQPEQLELVVRDNGVGLRANFDFEDTGSLGLLLVKRLTRQLDGTISLNQEAGTEFRITFPVNDLPKEA